VPNFVAPAFLLGLLFVPVVLWLHFVRRAQRERRVNALWLWTNEVSAAQRARFMPNLLLALQLIGIIAASVGAAGPRLELPGRDLVLILDASASMTAADMGSDAQPVSRLSVATRDAGKLFGNARKILVIRAGLSASVLAGPSSDRNEIRAALERIQAGDSSSDLAGALRLARSLAPNADLHLFTSIGLIDPGPPKNFRGTLHTIRGNGENTGITAFALRGTQAFVALESNLRAPRNATVRLERDGVMVARNTVRVPSGARATWLPKIKVESGEYKASLENTSDSERFDALELDDSAHAVIGAGRVLIAPPQDDVSRAVVSVPGVRAVAQNLPPNSSAGWGAIVLVGRIPKRLPPGNYLIFAPPESPSKFTGKLEPITTWDASAPELRFASLDGVQARISSQTAPEIADGGWTVLARAGQKPFISRGDGPGVRAVYIASDPSDSDLRLRPAFPVMVFNVLSSYLNVPAKPLGSRLPSQDPSIEVRAVEPGLFETGNTRFVANLVSSEQTRLPTGTSVVTEISPDGQPAESSSSLPANTPAAWTWLLLALALIALALEAILRRNDLGRIKNLFSRVRA
jgi:Aerotolerance regulator N-terminal/von Willebrand factor type A domain